MDLTFKKINTVQTHFLLSTERTGSSLLSLILNLHPSILYPSEEPFAIYFYKAYKNKIKWSDSEIRKFVDEFWLMSENNLNLFFITKENLYTVLIQHKKNLPYHFLIKIIYLQFIEPKPKQDIQLIVDKQLKYFFYPKQLISLFPEAKFIIIVRDPRVNAQRKKLRNLNSGSNAVYLTGIWNYTYKNIYYFKKHNKQLKIVKYEEFVSNPALIIEDICRFLDIPFMPEMLITKGVYESFLDLRKNKISDEELAHLKDFQSGLFTGINTDKIRLNENEIDEILNNKIIKITQSLLTEFGYEINSTKQTKLSLNDRLQLIKAYLYRPLLLKFYLQIPLSIKVLIKKIRR